MNKYQNFVIYKIYNISQPDNIYIGSTTDFNRRKSQHKKNTTNKRNKAYNRLLYKYIRLEGGFDNFKMEILEKYPCKTRDEGLKREKELIELNKSKLNIIYNI